MHLHAVPKCAEVSDLRTKDQVTKLGVREEYDEEHDSKTSDVFGALNKSDLTKLH